jgi:integrase
LRRRPITWLFPGNRWHTGDIPITTKVVWDACKEAAQRAGLQKPEIGSDTPARSYSALKQPTPFAADEIALHDLRRTCARLCHQAGGELDQIQFLLGHVSIQTTERYYVQWDVMWSCCCKCLPVNSFLLDYST